MSDTVHIKDVVQKAIDNASKAGFGYTSGSAQRL